MARCASTCRKAITFSARRSSTTISSRPSPTDKDAYNDKKNKFIGSITFVGPFPSKVEKASRKKILICDPATGHGLRREDRRPIWRTTLTAVRSTKTEVASLMKFVAMAKAQGQSTEQGIQLALEAMLVSPEFLFRIERDPNPTDPEKVHRLSDIELATRLSYFLWSSMPDDELLSAGGSGQAARDPAVLDAQVKRMMADQEGRRRSPTISPASGWKSAIWIRSRPTRRNSRRGLRN